MADAQFQITEDGQEVQAEDLNQLGQISGLAEDRAFAELFRLPLAFGGSPTVSKAVIPFGVPGDVRYDNNVIGSGAVGLGTVSPSGASNGSIKVLPFRAIVGATADIAVDGMVQAWRDIRSGLYAVSDDGSTPGHVVALAANVSGQPRYDLVYAAFARDANGASFTRYDKPASGGSVGPTTVVTTLVQAISIGVVTGTPGATPAIPSLPADTAGTYYIQLAFVLVVSGFGASSSVNMLDIYDEAPVRAPSATMGYSSMVPATESYRIGGTVLSGPVFKPGVTSGLRSPLYIPPSMSGEDSIFFAVDMLSGTAANWSHPGTALVDQSRDWRKRIFRLTVMASNSAKFAWDDTAASTDVLPGIGQSVLELGGQSFYNDGGGSAFGTPSGLLCVLTSTNVSIIPGGASVTLGVDYGTGNLIILGSTGTKPQVKLMFWVRASGRFRNA